MDDIRLIKIKDEILSESDFLAEQLREEFKRKKVFLINLMSSPGSGKTSLIIQTINKLKDQLTIGVIEGDIDSMVDSRKISAEGVKAIQIQTGGDCHLDAPMIEPAIKSLDLNNFDLLIVENIGNLVCPAEFDIGEALKVMILSVPEGHDKIFKYPLMFSVCDVLIVNKIDYLDDSDFDMGILRDTMNTLNPDSRIFEVSCKKGEGIDQWTEWLKQRIETYRSSNN